ncbi:hypothetical protein N9P55_00905 [bacterium]|nr:hypothetical protein [bacterium]MDB4089440.1 hypothetical protein [Flavobacteriales bacterium]
MAATTESKTIAIISHITIIGWIIAVVMNSNNKTEFASFYIRQTLLLNLVLGLGLTSFIGKLIAIVALVFIILSLLSALGGSKTESPFFGNYFQNWFKGL